MVCLKMVLTPATQATASKSGKPTHSKKVCQKTLFEVIYFLVTTWQKANQKSKTKLAFVRGE